MSIHKVSPTANGLDNYQTNSDSSPSNIPNDNLSVRVVVRVRPFFNEDLKKPGSKANDTSIVEINSEVGSLFIPPISLRYFYDHVLGEQSTQQDMFKVVQGLVPKMLEGFNVTILAYGQTSSGKTYTMGTGVLKNDDSDGIIPRAVDEIFSQVENIKEHSQVSLTASYLEIYNEEFIDLLIPDHYGPNYKPNIQILEDGKGNIVWNGVSELEVESVEDVMRLLLSGTAKRQIAETAMNSVSSRSHAIFSVGLKSVHKTETGSKVITQSKFHFVDLAGSERMKKTGASGNRAKEGININGGLLALGNVISALGKVPKMPHIPYRDSKLTRLLQDSIGGNSFTVFIACVSPAPADMSETQNTLLYANRAKKIKNKAIKNHTEVEDINALKQQLQELKAELESYKKSESAAATSTSKSTSSQSDPRAMQFLFERVEVLENDLKGTRTKYSDLRKRYTHLIQNYNRKADEVSFMQFDTMSNAPTEMSFMSDFNVNSNAETLKYEQLIQNLEEQLRQIREDYSNLEDKLHSEATAKSQLLMQNDQNLGEMFKLQQQLDELENDKKNLESRLSSNPSFVPVPDFDISSIHEVPSSEDDSKIEQIEFEMSQLQIQNQELQDLNNQLKEELNLLQKSPVGGVFPSPLPSHMSNLNIESDAASIESYDRGSTVEFEQTPQSVIASLEKREQEHLALIEQLRVQVLQLQNEKQDLTHNINHDSVESVGENEEMASALTGSPVAHKKAPSIEYVDKVLTVDPRPMKNDELSSEKLAHPPTNESTLNDISETSKERGIPNGHSTPSVDSAISLELTQLKDKLKDYEAQLEEKNKLIDTFHNNNDEKSAAIRKYKTRLTKQDSTIGLHQQQVNDLQSQIDNLTTQLSNEQLISSNYQEQITKLNQTIATLEAELQEAANGRTTLETDHAQEIQQYKDEVAKFESEVNDQQELISAYQDQITELENILEQTKIDTKKYQSQAEDFKTRSINLKTELDQMSSHLDQSMSNIEPLNSLVLELERHNDSLGNQYREVNNKLNHRDSELKDSMNKVEELQNNLSQMNASYKALKKEFDQFQILAQDVESQLVETQADVAELTLLHADSEALLLQKDEQIESLKSEIKRSKTLSSESPKEQELQSPEFSEANSELSIKVSSLEGMISQYKNQISLLQSSSDQKDQALHNLHLINEGLESERRENLMKHQEQLEELRESVNRYCSELATERDSHQKTQRQYQMIESRLEVMQEERALAQHAGSRKSKFLCF